MTIKPLKVLFAGTADFSASFLNSIIASEHQVIGVVTQIDKVSGRGKKVQMTKVKEIALQHDIPVYQFATSLRNPENYQELLKLDFNIMVVVAFGDILPIELLEHPQYKSINIHPSLLPFGRGASPVQNTIAKGDDKTAFCIIKMDATLDTGDILYWQDVEVEAKETSETLFAKLSDIGGPILTKVLDNIEYYLSNSQPQAKLQIEDPKKAYTRKIKKTHGSLKPHLKAITLERKLRAYTPWPGLFFTHPDEEQQDIKVIEANSFESLTSFTKYCTDNNIHLTFADNFCDIESTAKLNNHEYDSAEIKDLFTMITDVATNNSDLPFYQKIQGTIFAQSKQAFYILCGNASVLEISQVQLPGKKPTSVASIYNGYPKLFALGRKIV